MRRATLLLAAALLAGTALPAAAQWWGFGEGGPCAGPCGPWTGGGWAPRPGPVWIRPVEPERRRLAPLRREVEARREDRRRRFAAWRGWEALGAPRLRHGAGGPLRTRRSAVALVPAADPRLGRAGAVHAPLPTSQILSSAAGLRRRHAAAPLPERAAYRPLDGAKPGDPARPGEAPSRAIQPAALRSEPAPPAPRSVQPAPASPPRAADVPVAPLD